jgi:hypothetical protein
MNDSEFSDIQLAWRNQIGDFIVSFSEIEYISYTLWAEKINKDQAPHNFKDRARQVTSQLNGKKFITLKDLLERAIEIAGKRNTIAHNPMLIQIFQHHESKELNAEFAISSFSGEDYITLEQLISLVTEIEEIKIKLYKEIGLL